MGPVLEASPLIRDQGNSKLPTGDASFLDRNYTAFGKLIEGDDVLGKIGDTPVKAGGGGEKSKPLTRVGVESVRIQAAG